MPEEEKEEQEQQQEEEQPDQQGEDAIPRDALPEELRGLPADQIRSTTQALVSTLESRNEEVRQLREEMQAAGRADEVPEPEEEVEELSEDEFKDLILEDPDKALDHWLRRKGYAKRLEQIEEMATQGVRSGAYAQARDDLPNFSEYEDQVETILSSSGAAPTYGNIRGAYLMARGADTVEEESSQRGKTVTSEPPSPPEEEEEEPELSPGEDRARRALGMSKEDYLKHRTGKTEVTPPGIEE